MFPDWSRRMERGAAILSREVAPTVLMAEMLMSHGLRPWLCYTAAYADLFGCASRNYLGAALAHDLLVQSFLPHISHFNTASKPVRLSFASPNSIMHLGL